MINSRRCFSVLTALVLASPFTARDVGAQTGGVTVTLNTTSDPLKRVAVMPMVGALGDSVRAIVHRDLDYSDVVTPIPLDGTDRTPYLEPNRSLSYTFFDSQGIQFVVDLVPTGAGMHAALYDVAGKKVRWQRDYDVPDRQLSRDWRLRIHVISDDIVEEIAGTRGIAATRIAMTCPLRGGVGSVCIIDSDGHHNVHVPVEPNALSASWHPSGDTLIYNTFGGPSTLQAVALSTGQSRTLRAAVPNTQYLTPRYAPDGRAVYYSRSESTGSSVYRFNLAPGSTPQRLTGPRDRENLQIAVNHNGSLIAFMSDRAGNKEVYTMKADGTDQRLVLQWPDALSDKVERNEPDFSPDGRFIALAQQRDGIGNFQIVVVNLADQTARALTNQGVNEQPSWAPDNRHIVYTSGRTGGKELWIIDIVTGRTRQLTHNHDSKLGSWSPRLVPR